MKNTSGLSSTVLVAGIALVAGFAGGAIVMGSRSLDATPAPARSAITTHGEWVKYANARGDSIRAYVAYPEAKTRRPAIILIHEIFGLSDWEPTMADRFAGKGYVAIVPDLLSSRYGSTDAVKDSATRLVSALATDGLVTDLDATYRYVDGLTATEKGNIGVIGFCWGGGTVWKYAVANPRLKAAITCYGPPVDSASMAKIGAPVLALYGESDQRITGTRPDVTRWMAAMHKSFASSIYKGTGHGFLKPGRSGYGTPEYDRALGDIDAFFAKQLDHK